MLKIDMHIKPSKYYLSIMLLLFVVSLAIVISLSVTLWVKAALIAGVCLYLGFILWDQCLLNSALAVHGLSYDDGWFLHEKNSMIAASLCGSSTLTGFVSILRFAVENKKKKRSFLIFKDSISPGLYRQLLVQLRTLK
ncbi:MAG: hypothetical protein P4M12_06735 [Gammaproteobacteria bacterium]|nr:hypothetical protein [Gammaproteobacteria bacterium]